MNFSTEYLANGFPKSGCHALAKGMELLGVPEARVIHVKTLAEIPEGGKVVTIFRHPKNCLVSMCRWRSKPLCTGSLIQLINDYDGAGLMVKALGEYEHWQQDGYWVRYEDLVTSDAALRGVAEHLGIPFLENAWPNLPGLTLTWTGKPSDWREHWNEHLDNLWRSEGLHDLQERLGYVDG